MSKELSIEERFKIDRPVIGEHRYDLFDIPVIKKITEDMIDLKNIRPLNIQNLSRQNNNADKLVLPFAYDNLYKNRWLGCLWQDFGIMTIPTIGWTTREWDNLNFSGVERGSIVVISTLGCKRNPEYFMRGYNEMIRRLAPPLLIGFADL